MMRLVKDKALVIVGPQGSGKTQIARELAASAGTYAEVDGFSLRKETDWRRQLAGGHTTLLIDGVPDDEQMDMIKQILCAKGKVAMRVDGVLLKVSMPYLIFTTCDLSPSTAGRNYRQLFMCRRMDIKHIHQPGHA